MYSANDIGDWFLTVVDRESGDSITHLKLQKLVYYAQAWSLVILGKPLFEEDFEAWAHGPVVRSVFDKWRGSGWDALPSPEDSTELDEITSKFLDDIYQTYGDLTAKKLEEMTHNEAPWLDARGNLPPEVRSNQTISKDNMHGFYQRMLEELDAEERQG